MHADCLGWGEQGHVQEMETEPVVGSLGSISTGPQPPQDYFGASNTGFEDEPPLLVGQYWTYI